MLKAKRNASVLVRYKMRALRARWTKSYTYGLIALILVSFGVRHFIIEGSAGVDGSSFTNSLVQCMYRSYRDTSDYRRRSLDPYDTALLSCDENHQYGFNDPKYPTDKCSRHRYLPLYEPHMKRIRDSKPRMQLLEVGVKNGGSLMLWRSYFSVESMIFGLDVNQAAPQFQHEAGIKILLGDSRTARFDYFDHVCLDIILDDGLHLLGSQRATFRNLKKYLCPGGVYIIEDVLTKDRAIKLGEYFKSLKWPFEQHGPDDSGEYTFIVPNPIPNPNPKKV